MHTAVDHCQVGEMTSAGTTIEPAVTAGLAAEGARILTRGTAKLAGLMAANQRRIRARTMLVAPYVEDNFVYRVRSGWLAQSHTMADGRHHDVHIFLAGDLLRISTLFSPEHADSITAITDVAVESVHRHELLQAVLEDADISARCLWEMRQQEKRLEQSVVGLGQRSAKERLCALLLELRARLLIAGCLPADTCRFEMPLTQAQLGTHLGLTPVHINRVLKELRGLGILQLGRGQAAVMDLEALQQHANL